MKKLTLACFGSAPQSAYSPLPPSLSWRDGQPSASPVTVANSVDGMNPHVPATVAVTGLVSTSNVNVARNRSVQDGSERPVSR